jgi:hypothetical protein
MTLRIVDAEFFNGGGARNIIVIKPINYISKIPLSENVGVLRSDMHIKQKMKRARCRPSFS